VVLVQSESGSDSGSDAPGIPIEIDSPLATDTHLARLESVPFDPVTFPADRIASWLQNVSIPEGIETETGSPIGSQPATPRLLEGEESGNEPLDETPEVTTVTPEATVVLDTCTTLLNKLEEVKLAVLQLQYSLRVGTTGPREPRLEAQDRAHRLWSWDHAGVFLAELPCP
jgi:hypothetical protein